MKKLGTFLKVILMLALFTSPFILFFAIQYFEYDSQYEGDPYKVVFENNGKSYELQFSGNDFAFDKETGGEQLYLDSFNDLGYLIALSYSDFKIAPTDNSFFSGKITIDNSQKYYAQKTKYSTPKDSYQSYTFYDQNKNQIFAYDPTGANEFVVKLRPTFPYFSKTRYTTGNVRDYLSVTKFLKEKLNKNLKFRIDAPNKLMILSFEN